VAGLKTGHYTRRRSSVAARVSGTAAGGVEAAAASEAAAFGFVGRRNAPGKILRAGRKRWIDGVEVIVEIARKRRWWRWKSYGESGLRRGRGQGGRGGRGFGRFGGLVGAGG